MTTFASDAFTGTIGTTLQAHTATTGQAWSKGTGGGLTYSDAILTDVNRLRASDANGYLYSLGYSHSGDDYAVKCDAVIQTVVAGNVGGPIIRAATITGTAHTYVMADVFPTSNQYRLFGVTNNTFTSLGTYTPGTALAAGQTHTLELRALDDAFALLVDGTGRIAAAFPAIAGIGTPGVRGAGGGTPSNSVGVHLDVFAVADFSLTGSLAAPTLSTATVKVAAVDLTWTAVSDPAFFRYIVDYKRSADSTWITAFGTTGTAGRVNGLTPGTAYDFRIRSQALDLTIGTGSNVLSATPTAAPAQPAGYNDITGTHTGAVTPGVMGLTGDGDKAVHYGGGVTTFNDDPAFDVGATCTLRAMVQPDSLPAPGSRRILIDRTGCYNLKINGSSLEGTVIIGGVPVTVTASNVFQAGTKADPALVYDGATLQLYSAGVAVGSSTAATGSVDSASANITVGNNAGLTQGFIGTMQHPEVLAEPLDVARFLEDALLLSVSAREINLPTFLSVQDRETEMVIDG